MAYLGLIASGICFFLWNSGARQVGGAALAVLNNVKIPLAITVSLLVFREQADIHRLLAGGGLIVGAALLTLRKRSPAA
jgi:drug/metabolite transporter (DMT)-like permease